jgi:polar amino acid transport system substrate-binding protein/arginine/ornithine transport system substrate-binding protein
MGVKCTLVEQDWDGMIPALISRRFDIIVASMSVTEERKRRVDFSDKYYNTPARLVVRKGSGIRGTKEGLSGKRVGVQRGATHQCYAEKFFTDSAVKLYGTQEEVFLDLAAGRIDAQLSDAVQAEEGFLSTPSGKDFEFLPGNQYDLGCHGVGAGVALRKGNDGLRTRLNKAIKAIRANGIYKKINDKYFGFDVYGD